MFGFTKWKVSGEDDASNFADDTLEVFQNAGTWVYSRYLSFKVLKGDLGGYLAFVTDHDILSPAVNSTTNISW